MKNEVKNCLFSKPVTHRDLFGSDFESVAEQALKAQNSAQKVMYHPKQGFRPVQSPLPPPTAGPSSSNTNPQAARDRPQPFRQRRGRSFNNRGRPAYYRRK